MFRSTLRLSRPVLGKSFATNALTSNKLFDKILIANRGEIACRVIKTARKMGIKTVAVYSEADKDAEHVKLADESYFIGPAPAAQSYLKGEKIIEACLNTGAKAVHPGYGFLSENLDFCQLCTDNNITFIGPPPNAIRAMGSKSESKDIMIKANVPVTPGYHGSDNSNDTLLMKAREVGFPLMIKAVAGGGGKGMRLVETEDKFLESLESCRGEALRSFKDDQVLIERLIRKPRHVEFQVFGDHHGNAVHLFERDCSIQRRHQKVLEEAPAPNLTPQMRQAMSEAAVACVKATGYVGAGTVEFLIDSISNEFFFCEMNTRLQVEHPITEMITDLDLVEWQLRIASGEPIPLPQEQIKERTKGCAIEARIYAENPVKNFMPCSGHLAHLSTPIDRKELLTNGAGGRREENGGVRVDSGVVKGNDVSTYYDPMIAKLIAYGNNREEALIKLENSLRNYQVAGLPNNIDFLIKCVRHKGFAKEQPTTHFFNQYMDEILSSLEQKSITEFDSHGVFSIASFNEAMKILKIKNNDSHKKIWQGKNEFSNFRNSSTPVSNILHVVENQENIIINSSSSIDGTYQLFSNEDKSNKSTYKLISSKVVSNNIEKSRNVQCIVLENVIEKDSKLIKGTSSLQFFTNGDVQVDSWLEGQTGENSTHYNMVFSLKKDIDVEGGASSNPVVLSPMPGKIVKVLATDGKEVKKGEPLVVLEAMKMEHIVYAPCDGIVSIFCNEATPVQDGSKLAEVLPSTA